MTDRAGVPCADASSPADLGAGGAVMSLGRITLGARPVTRTPPIRATRIRSDTALRSPRTATTTARPVVGGRVPCCVATGPPRSKARTSPRAVRARSRIPTTWPLSKGGDTLLATGSQPRANLRARTRSQPPGFQRRGGRYGASTRGPLVRIAAVPPRTCPACHSMISGPTTRTPVPRAVDLDLAGHGARTGCSCLSTRVRILGEGSPEAMAEPMNHAVTKH